MAEQAERRTHALRIVAAAMTLVLMALGIGSYWYFVMRGIVYSDDARFSGHLVDLAPELAGTLSAVSVQEGDRVSSGQVLFCLNPSVPGAVVSQREASLNEAKARLPVAEARYDRAVHGYLPEEIKAAEATRNRQEAEKALALVELKRAEELQKRGVVAQDQLDRAKTTYDVADHMYEQAVQNLSLLQQGTRKEDIAAAKSEVEAAKGAIVEAETDLARAKLDVDRSTVSAPFDGVIVRRWLDPGAMVQPGQPVVTAFDPSTLRVDANIEERFLHRVAIGDEVDISVDSYPSVRLKGRVEEILQATNSRFSLIPAEGVSGSFIKVTQRVPLRISVNAPAELPIGPGLSVEVRIREGSAPRLRTQGAKE